MSTRRRGLAALFGGGGGGSGSRETQHGQPVPSPPATPRPGPGLPPIPQMEERILTSEELQQSVESLETVLKTMDQVRDQTNRYNAALREHARSLRMYAVGINMISTRSEGGQQRVTADTVPERLLAHCANYYDRLTEAQEALARTFLEEYNILNNYAAKHFKTLAKDSAKLDSNLKDLTRKLSKLTHRSAAPGTANTQNASTMQSVGVHEMYAQKLTSLSSEIQQVRREHLRLYTLEQKNVDRYVSRTFARCSRQNYAFLADALVKTGSAEAIGGVNAWGVFANAGISPPIGDLDADDDGDVDADDDWEQSQVDPEEPMTPREIAQSQPARPPSAFTDFSELVRQDGSRARSYGNVSMTMQGRLPAQGSQPTFQPYPGSSQSQAPSLVSPQPVNASHRNLLSGTIPAHQQYAPIAEETHPNGLGMTQNISSGQIAPGLGSSRFTENFSPPTAQQQ